MRSVWAEGSSGLSLCGRQGKKECDQQRENTNRFKGSERSIHKVSWVLNILFFPSMEKVFDQVPSAAGGEGFHWPAQVIQSVPSETSYQQTLELLDDVWFLGLSNDLKSLGTPHSLPQPEGILPPSLEVSVEPGLCRSLEDPVSGGLWRSLEDPVSGRPGLWRTL